MKTRRLRAALSALILCAASCLAAGFAAAQMRDDRAIERRIDALLARMTVEEKVGQLNLVGRQDELPLALLRAGKVGGAMNYIDPREIAAVRKAARESRLKIPPIMGLDAVHGIATYFPLPLGQAASWNLPLIEEASNWVGREAAAMGIDWTFAPMVDVTRDPRWGRTLEGAGEDPFLGARIAEARVRGYQTAGLAASVKHFVGYGAPEGGRDYNSAWIPTEQLFDIYLPPFEAALKAGSMTVMAAFHALNGMPATGSRALLTDLLRKRYGFRGFVVSDFDSIGELTLHGIAKDRAEAARKALLAGVDMDMFGGAYMETLPGEVRAGRIPTRVLDEAVRRILRVKLKLGLFEKPDVDPKKTEAALRTPAARDAARRMARESIILLKNAGDILPVGAGVKSIAVIGALARHEEDRVWTDPAGIPRKETQTLLAAIEERAKGAVVRYAKGVDACGVRYEERESALEIARQSDLVIAMLGEDCEWMGEGASRTTLDLPGVQPDLLRDLVATGKPVALVLATGRPLVLTWANAHVAAILQTFHAGTEGRTAIAEILFGEVSPSAKTTMSFPRSVGQLPLSYDVLPTGRPQKIRQRYESIYLDEANEPLFPFGFGLSFTRFAYANLSLSQSRAGRADTVSVSVDVKNIGERAGQEIVELYVRQPVASRSRPIRQLKGFAKVSLAPGETRRVSIPLPAASLGFHDETGRYAVEPGRFDIYVGGSLAADLTAALEVSP
ncbi:MAG: glycoside hydrolase family 3 C-terminal domain-containing protein [Rhizobiales bacterium]|nr:glycoside hydrolase family 3 C-terminal domain-containing protein [Hyphomicrobiales bacterium]